LINRIKKEEIIAKMEQAPLYPSGGVLADAPLILGTHGNIRVQ
jgi:hypothetical protein